MMWLLLSLQATVVGCSFPNIGIQCCKRHDVEESLRTREKIRVDPFGSKLPQSNMQTTHIVMWWSNGQYIRLVISKLMFYTLSSNDCGQWSCSCVTQHTNSIIWYCPKMLSSRSVVCMWYYVDHTHHLSQTVIHSPITACTVVQAVVKANSQSNGKGQILTPWGSETPKQISMKLGIYIHVAGMPAHANPCGAATTWVVWANTWKNTCCGFLCVPF